MRDSWRRTLDLTVVSILSALFTAALLYATLEVPRFLNSILIEIYPDWGLHFEMEKMRETIELLRPFGYAAFISVIALIIVGFVLGRTKISTFASLGLYLPVFGHFALSMFLLAGIGVLRALWLPILDVSPNLLRLGDVIYTLYIASAPLIEFIMRLSGVTSSFIHVGGTFSIMVMLVGLVIFFLGTITWLYGKVRGCRIIDFWIYSLSRHPQYLGFTLWSYGLLILAMVTPSPRGGYMAPPSLLWLISMLTVVGSALHEENQLIKSYGEEYLKYRGRVPFMIPLPEGLKRLLTAPVRLLLGKEMPERGREIALVLTLYGLILISPSIPLILT